MKNVLKLALLYTGVYFVFIAAYWVALVTITVFWKPLAWFFCCVFVLMGVEYFVKRRQVLGKFGLKPSGNEETDRRAFAKALFTK
jgi:hypothetical protein